MIACEVFATVVNKSTTFAKTRTQGGFFCGGRPKMQILLQYTHVSTKGAYNEQDE